MGIEDKIESVMPGILEKRQERAARILALMKEEGYLHPTDLVEGWVVHESYQSEDMQYPEDHVISATLQDILGGKAVKG